ncbi:MAG: hypothetical protein AB8G05_22705 [Oligoflexales bacterium]
MFIKNLFVIISALFLCEVSFGTATPTKRPRSHFKTPTSSERKDQKRARVQAYDTNQIPEAFHRIVTYYSNQAEEKSAQLKLLATELWSNCNKNDPSAFLTGSLAMSFWYCKYNSEEDCFSFLENRAPKDIDLLVESLTLTEHLLPDEYAQSADIDRGEKTIQYLNQDKNLFGYDIILMGSNGMDFGSKHDLVQSESGDYVPVLGLLKLLDQKKLSYYEDKKSSYSKDISTLKDLIDIAGDEQVLSDIANLESPAKAQHRPGMPIGGLFPCSPARALQKQGNLFIGSLFSDSPARKIKQGSGIPFSKLAPKTSTSNDLRKKNISEFKSEIINLVQEFIEMTDAVEDMTTQVLSKTNIFFNRSLASDSTFEELKDLKDDICQELDILSPESKKISIDKFDSIRIKIHGKFSALFDEALQLKHSPIRNEYLMLRF